MKCPRGWILTTNDQGFMVPFFVKTRSVDVFYSSSVSDKFNEAGIITEVPADKITIIPPGQTYLYKTNEWDIQLNNDESFQIRRNLSLSTSSLSYGADNKCIQTHVDFPFQINFDFVVDTHIEKLCSDLGVITAHINIKYDEKDEDEKIHGMTIEFYKFDGSVFSGTELEDQSFINSENQNIIQISIIGIADLGEYSHTDDGNQIGAYWDGSSSGIGAKDVYTKSETDALVNKLRSDVKTGKVLTPPNIIDVADDVSDSAVLPTGIIIDIDENSSIASENVNPPDYIDEGSELSEKLDDPSITHINIDDIQF